MQNFYTDHHQEAFGCMAEILGHNFNFQKKVSFITIDFVFNLCCMFPPV